MSIPGDAQVGGSQEVFEGFPYRLLLPAAPPQELAQAILSEGSPLHLFFGGVLAFEETFGDSPLKLFSVLQQFFFW